MHAVATALPKRLSDWYEGRSALRMLVAALGAYICTSVIHVPGPYSAVITTLIVARPHSGGVLRASFERLVATLLGAGVACIATFGRLLHIPELWLIAAVLAPLALVAAHNTAFRTAMIAAIIVLSAPAASGAPLYVAGARMLGVSLGAVIGALVSITIVPSRREVVVATATARLLEQYPGLLQNALHSHIGDERSRDKFEFRIRQSLRELGMLIRDRADALPTKGPAAAVVKFAVQMHADISFLKRELPYSSGPPGAGTRSGDGTGASTGAAPGTGANTVESASAGSSAGVDTAASAGVASSAGVNTAANADVAPSGRGAESLLPVAVVASLENFSRAFLEASTQVAAMARGRAGPPDIQPLRDACRHAAQSLHQECPNSEGARLMLRRLVEDLGALIRSIERAGVGA
jgi:hypothetical protein